MNLNAQAYDQYKRTSIETVAPEKLLLMLYDGALKNIHNAKKAITQNDVNVAHNEIMKAEEIVLELMCTLNMEYEVSQSLYLLYDFLYNQLVQANAGKDVELLSRVEQFLVELKQTWQEAIQILKAAPVPEGKKLSGINVKG